MNVRNILVHVVFVQILIFLFPSVVKAHVVFLEMLIVVDLREVVGLKEQPADRTAADLRHIDTCRVARVWEKRRRKVGVKMGPKFTPEWGMFPCRHMIPESCVSRNLVGFDGFFWF